MIGYYAHHRGSGHLTRMCSVAAAAEEKVWGLSSGPRPAGWSGGWTALARDDLSSPTELAGVDTTAHRTLHWVPPHDEGLARRSAQIAAWAADHRPRLLVVDVSVEVALLARLCGVPTVVVAMPGRRDDPAHRLAYDSADAILAPWPAGAHDGGWPEHWTRKAMFVGGVSRFDGRQAPTTHTPDPGPRRGGTVLLLWGAGGRDTTPDQVRAARDATPGWSWVERAQGPGQSSASLLWDELQNADVVVSHAGQNIVAEIAAARRPAVIVAQPRPHDEQGATARRLADWQIAVGLSGWPPAVAWPAILDQAVARGGQGWSRWSDGHGARRAARLLADVGAASGRTP